MLITSNVEAHQMTEKELEIIKSLRELNISRSETRTLLFLFKNNEGLAKNIERGSDLRQPELSNAAKSLLERGWIKSITVKSEGKGRPQIKYSLAKPKSDIVKAIGKLFMDKIHSLEADMKDFNELMKEV